MNYQGARVFAQRTRETNWEARIQRLGQLAGTGESSGVGFDASENRMESGTKQKRL